MSRRRRAATWVALAVIVLCTAAIRVRLLLVPLERDEGEYAYAGQLMLQGTPPYSAAFNMKLPGTYAAYAFMMWLFGQTIAGIHLGFLFLNVGTILIVYLLGRRLFGAEGGVAASALYALLSTSAGVLGSQAHASHFVVAFALAGTLVLLRAVESKRGSTFFLSGVLYGLAVLMKQPGVLFAVFGGLFTIWSLRQQWRRGVWSLGVLTAGALTPLGLTCILLWRAGVFPRFWFWTVTYAREYGSSQSVSDGMNALLAVFPGVAGPNSLIWLIAAAGLVCVWLRKEERTRAVFLTGFTFFSFAAVCPGLYFREHYFVMLLPALALLAGGLADFSTGIRGGRMVAWGSRVLIVVAIAASVYQQRQFLFEMDPVAVSRKMYPEHPFPEAIPIANYIRAHTSKDSRIAILGSEPEIPFYAGRRSATGYIYMYPLMEEQPYALSMQAELIADIESVRPEYVVVAGIPLSWLRRILSASMVFEWWKRYGEEHYTVVGVADIIPGGRTRYRWGDEVTGYRPESNSLMLIYRRRD